MVTSSEDAPGLRADQDAMPMRDTMCDLGVICCALAGCALFCPPLGTTDARIGRIVDAVAPTAAG